MKKESWFEKYCWFVVIFGILMLLFGFYSVNQYQLSEDAIVNKIGIVKDFTIQRDILDNCQCTVLLDNGQKLYIEQNVEPNVCREVGTGKTLYQICWSMSDFSCHYYFGDD